jgi:two-component system, NtrC family, sensor kinase
MRYGFLFLLLCIGLAGFAKQPSGPVRIDTIQPNGLALKKGWRWHTGDNLAWANPSFDDRHWKVVKAPERIGKQPQPMRAGVSWFRLAILLDSTLSHEALTVDVQLNGAADLYIDGALVQSFGRVGANPATIHRFKRVRGQTYLLPTLAPGLHTLAVRFCTYPTPWYIPTYLENKETLELTLCRPEAYTRHLVGRTHTKTLLNYLIIGSFLMLSAIHFLYYFYRRQTINLTFGITALCFCLNSVVSNLPPYLPSLEAASWADYLGTVFSFSFPVLLSATYYLYIQRKHGPVFWSMTGLTLVCLLLVYAIPRQRGWLTDLPRIILGLCVAGLLLDGLRITVVALRQARTREKAVVILVSFSLLIIFIVLCSLAGSLIVLFLQHDDLSETILDVLFTLTSFGIPLTLAVLLAKEHDQTNSDLQKRLKEVEKLSGEKENILTQQKILLEEQVVQRTASLNQSLDELRQTQTQLVQKEKMASLGELTAGIAHEIQNPLNFVNNFSEVSAELIKELQEEREKGAERDEGVETELLTDLGQNVQKITQHGRRAANIVRGMLQHSRASTGERTQTDLNALADEYLRLSYHGLRAKDKSFNANLHTSLDPALEPACVVAQDIGRVLLNLFNNAFYAVWEKQKTAPPAYRPTVWLHTRQLGGHIELRVQDNGNGIPADLQRKIFQPFFTTKPTGQGTGLGLSLSYDIITKGHAGTLAVETSPGEHTTFIITLPTTELSL